MALLSDTDPDPTPPSTLCCDSPVGAYKHSDPEKKGKECLGENIPGNVSQDGITEKMLTGAHTLLIQM